MNARKMPLHGSDNPPALFRHGLLVLSLIGPGPAVLGAETAQPFFKQYCVGCHGAKEPDADLSLLNLGPMDPQNAEVWHRVLNQMASGEMPPSQEKQPSDVERTAMTQRILGSMREAGVLGQALGPLPSDGNRLEHSLLFGDPSDLPGYSPARFWRQSQPQYDALMERLWVIPRLRYEKAHHRNDPGWAAYSYAKPFPGLEPRHFVDYSGSVHADEAVLRALLDAGGQIAERLLSDKTAYAKEIQPPIAAGIAIVSGNSLWSRFMLVPPKHPLEFEPFLKEGSVSVQQRHTDIGRVFKSSCDETLMMGNANATMACWRRI